MKPEVKIYKTRNLLAEKLAYDFVNHLQLLCKTKKQVNIALSGGSTPNLFFDEMIKVEVSIDWKQHRFFWVDERCVPKDHPESNFGMAYERFILPLGIPESSYFRIKGENDPSAEAISYASIIKKEVTPELPSPVFDIIFLGIGTDGHTASIFPHQINLWQDPGLCTVGVHPDTGQKRVSFTGKLINDAERVIFMVSGREKSQIVRQVINRTGQFSAFPASLVNPNNGILQWYLDEEAGNALS